jgi:hypothetical protein
MVISTAIHMPVCVAIKCEIYTMLQSRMDVQINMASLELWTRKLQIWWILGAFYHFSDIIS